MNTKLFAVVIVALLALSIVPVLSFDPDPEDPPFVKYIDPQEIKFTGPCTESQRFTAEDMVYMVEDLYAWDIVVNWDSTYLELESYTINIPADWPADGYTILIDDVDPLGPDVAEHPEWIHYAVTRLGNVSGFSGTMSLLTMEFHVVYEPCYMGGCQVTYIWNEPYWFAGPCGYVIEPDWDEEGVVHINPSRPNMELLLSDTFDLEAKDAQGWYEDQVIEVYLWVSNVTKFYGMAAHITWNSALLRIDMQQIHINEEAFPQPWEFLVQDLSPGDFYFEIYRPCEKPPLKGTFWMLKFEFKVKCYYDQYEIPIGALTCIDLCESCSGLYMCGDWYNSPTWLDLSTVCYHWTPIPYDFDQNGHVGVEDIMIALDHYGESFAPGEGFDFDGDGDCDIYDIVIVAKHYCNDVPPEL